MSSFLCRTLPKLSRAPQGGTGTPGEAFIGPKDSAETLIRVSFRTMVFGLWRVYFPPCLVRPGRRLPVQGLSEGSLGFLDRLPA